MNACVSVPDQKYVHKRTAIKKFWEVKMYVPWQPLDVVKQGRIRWNRGRTFRARTGLFINQTYWVVEPAHAPYVTGFGVLVSKVHHKYSGLTPGLLTIYSGFTHDLSRVLAKYDIKEDSVLWKAIAKNPFWRGYWGYRVSKRSI